MKQEPHDLLACSFRQGGLLLIAEDLINKDRRHEYGPAKESFQRIADMWSIYLNTKVTPKDVALCMVLFKICREMGKPKLDNLVDAAGYIGLAGDLLDV